MLHAACQVHFAFMRVARMACFIHEQLWLFYMHACMVLCFACMNMGMHADAKIVQLLLSSVPHVWTKRCVASPFLSGVPRFEKMSRLWNFCADDNTLSLSL